MHLPCRIRTWFQSKLCTCNLDVISGNLTLSHGHGPLGGDSEIETTCPCFLHQEIIRFRASVDDAKDVKKEIIEDPLSRRSGRGLLTCLPREGRL